MKNTTIFPSANTWVTPRTDPGRLDSSNCKIVFNQKISKLDKVLLYLPEVRINNLVYSIDEHSSFTARNLPLSQMYTDSTKSQSLVELDVTKYAVEKAEYATLDTYSAFDIIPWGKVTLNNAWYWEQNGNEITLLNSRPNIFSEYIPESIIHFALYDYALAHGGIYIRSTSGVDREGIASAENFKTCTISGVNLMNMQFRIYYTPLGESVNLTTPKTEPQEHQFTIPFSQQQQIVTASALGKNMQAMANRTGVPVRIVKRKVDKLSLIRKVGSIWHEKDENGNYTGNIYRLTSQTIQIAGCKAFITERWSKNWTSQSEYIGINREFRSWKIPADIVQRNLHVQDYCYITADAEVNLPSDSDLTADAKKYLLYSLNGDGTDTNTECGNMWFYNRDKEDDSGVVLNCSAFGFGNSLVFSGKTKDNLSAGTQRVKSDDNDDNYQYCKDVYYCNEDGTMDRIFVQIASEIANNSSTEALNSYPQVTSEMNTASGIKLFDEHGHFAVLKDPAEQLNFTYQLHLVTHDSDLVIGASWAANCPLVVSRTSSVKLLYWNLTLPLPKGMQTMSKSWGNQRPTPPVTVNYTDGGSFTIQPMTCVTDEKHNIIVAYNGRMARTFYMKYTHDYDRLQKEYNRLHAGQYRDATFGI